MPDSLWDALTDANLWRGLRPKLMLDGKPVEFYLAQGSVSPQHSILDVEIDGKRVLAYMSGYTDDEFVRRGELPRDHLFLQKPFTGDDLLNTIGEALSARAPASDAAVET